MPTTPVQRDPRDRVISTTVAVVSLVVGALPLSGFVVAVVRNFLHHEPWTPPVLLLVVAAGFIGISVTILRDLRRREVFHWLGGGPATWLQVLLVAILGAMVTAETIAIEHLMVRLGVRSGVANILSLMPVIAGGLLFAFYWRRASAARV
jgi:hypothetical protein